MRAPREQVYKIHSRSPCHHTVKVIWVRLDRLESLATTSRAPEIVRFVKTFFVEFLGELLAHNNTCMDRAIGKVFDHFGVVIERLARRSIVAVVSPNSSKSVLGSVRKVIVLNAYMEKCECGNKNEICNWGETYNQKYLRCPYSRNDQYSCEETKLRA